MNSFVGNRFALARLIDNFSRVAIRKDDFFYNNKLLTILRQ